MLSYFQNTVSKLLTLTDSTIPGQMAVVSLGRGLGFALGMFTNIYIIRYLGPSDYGVYSLGVAIILLCNGIVGDALDIGLLRTVPVFRRDNEKKARDYILGTVQLKILCGLLLFTIFWVFNKPLAAWLFKNPGGSSIITLAAVGVLCLLLSKSISIYLQAMERFNAFVLIDFSNLLIKFLVVLILLYMQSLTIITSFILYVFSPLLVFILFFHYIPPGYFFSLRIDKISLASIISYSKWVLVSFSLSAIHSRLDIFMLGIMGDSQQVGIYSAALTLALVPELAGSFAANVMYPKIMLYYNQGIFKPVFLKMIAYTLPFCVLTALLAITSAQLFIPLLFSREYLASVVILKVIISGYIFWWLILPMASPFIYMTKPTLMIYIDFLTILFVAGGNLIMIPLYGSIGAAWVNLISRILIGITIISLVLYLLRQRPILCTQELS